MLDTNFIKIQQEVEELITSMKYSPVTRLESRKVFYKKYGGDKTLGKFGYGNSELAFMKWENGRVIRHPDSQPPGSAWWDAVNLWYIYLSEFGAKAKEAELPKQALPVAAQFWYDFIENPNASTWYRAHNSSIIDGYLKYPNLAQQEGLPEQIFINIVLYRLLFAQAMTEGADFAFGRLGKIFANPKSSAVDLITQFEDFYPDNYPMTEDEVNDMLGKSHELQVLGMKFLDDVIIEPEFAQLYQSASEWNGQPKLVRLLVNNKPAYPDRIPKSEGKKKYLIRFLIYLRRIFN